MNLFVIPSWYPHRCYPVEGEFIRDQALAIGELKPDWKVALSLWDQGRGFVSTAHFLHSPRCLAEALMAHGSSERALRDNVLELERPALAWRHSVLGGNREGLLRANRENLQRAIARFGRIDLLHAHVSYPAGWIAMRLAAETVIPFVITEHQAPFPLAVYQRSDRSLEPALREPLERANARVAVSPALAARIASFGIAEPEFVPNMVDDRLFELAPRAAGREVSGTPGGASRSGDAPFVFFTLGTLEPRKGISDLLDAIALLLPKLSDEERGRVSFRIGGDGPQRVELRAHAERLGLGVRVAWLGPLARDRVVREFQACDCFVLPSRQESFGIVFAEAAACGKPLIGTASGGPEFIVTPENGVLVEIGKPDSIRAALERMLREVRRYDPAAIREQTVARFGRAAVVAKLEEVYRRAIASAPRPASG